MFNLKATGWLLLAVLLSHSLNGQVNTSTSGAQQNPAIAMDSTGNYTIVWESEGSDGDDYGIYGQRFSASSVTDGSEFKINSTTDKGQRFPDIAMGDGGDFVVCWMSMDQDGDSWGIYFQRYNNSGTAQGSETLVNTTTQGVQRFPSIAMDNNENFVIVWCEIASNGTQSIKGQRYNSSGSNQGSEFTVNSSSTTFQGYPDIAMNRNTGDFTVVWQSDTLDGSGMGIYAQRYNSSGTAQGGEFKVNTTTSEHQREPRIAMDTAGSFVTIWSSYNQDGSSYGVYGQRYNGSGSAQGSEFKVNGGTTGAQVAPALAMTIEGSFVVIWAGFDSGSQAQPYLTGYDSNGDLFKQDTLYTSSENFQLAPDIALYNEDLKVVFSFQQGHKGGSNGDGSDFGIYANQEIAGDLIFDGLNFKSSTPSSGSVGLGVGDNLTFTFDDNVSSSSVNNNSIGVWGSQSGKLSGSFSGGGTSTITFNPADNLFPGEKITVSLNTNLENTDSRDLNASRSLIFDVGSSHLSLAPNSHKQNPIGEARGASNVYAADIDDDGDIDFLASARTNSQLIWFQNDGNENFTADTIFSDSIGIGPVLNDDLDGDGDMDIVYINQASGDLYWLENDGSENFTSHTVSSSLSNPIDILAIDLDIDGDVDLLAANYGDNSISWFENNGSQSFNKIEVYRQANGIQSIYAADIDTDGDLDVLSASFADDKIRWYENDGKMSFSAHEITATADGATDVYAMDIDGDGDIDVISASSENNELNWYSNDGSQSFTTNLISIEITDPRDVVALDYDGDSDIDIVAAMTSGKQLAWFENDGSESFTLHSVDTSANVERAEVADVNGDGYLDIISTSNDSNFVWYQNALTLKSTNPVNYSIANSANTNIVLDFNESVKASTISTSNIVVRGSQTGLIGGSLSGGGTSSITFNPTNDFKAGEIITITLTTELQNTGSASMNSDYSFQFTVASSSNNAYAQTTPPASTISNSTNGAKSVYAVDIDSDGDMDVVSASYDGGTIEWHENDASQSFTTKTISSSVNGANSVYAADVDGDGDMDVLSASSLNNTIAWYDNNGSESFTAKTISSQATGASSIQAADMDGDGDMDIVYAASNFPMGDTIGWYENDGSENFSLHVITSITAGVTSTYPVDVDKDGDMDILASSSVNGSVIWLQNDGSENFNFHTITSDANGASFVYGTDIDGDGDMDILAAAASADKIEWYENDGSQEFTTHLITVDADSVVAVYAADMDGDGDIDVLSASGKDDKIAWYQNNGSQIFTTYNLSTTADGASSVYAADLDADGDLDVLAASFNDDNVIWYENRIDLSFSLKAFLDGPFDTANHQMSNTLNNIIPKTAADSAVYGSSHSYSGSESFNSAPATAVDWVLIELRDADSASAATSSTIVSTVAGILHQDGSITDADGSGNIVFSDESISNGAFVIIRHRNHVAIMNSSAITDSGGVYTFDFTTAQTKAYGSALVEVESGVWGMYSGDIIPNNDINASDIGIWTSQNGTIGQYLSGDVNMNADVNAVDYSIWSALNGTIFGNIP